MKFRDNLYYIVPNKSKESILEKISLIDNIYDIHFDTLENLCNIFNCEIGEIIELKKEKENVEDEQINKKTK